MSDLKADDDLERRGGTTTTPRSNRAALTVFALALLGAAVFINQTVFSLPPQVAVRFDPDGHATSFMAAAAYRRFVLVFAVLVPIAVVAALRSAYSKASTLKLPNREYWLAPQRIASTRAFLIAHGIWFGTLLVTLMAFTHGLILDANRHQPPALSNTAMLLGLLALLGCMLVWIGILMVAFRRP
jgi:hypothetical protein